MITRRVWLCLPPIIFCFLDHGLTLGNQSGRFWSGQYLMASEANPISYRLLSQHPLAFGAGFTVWIILFVVLIVSLPLRPAMILSVAITFGHLWGVASWVMNCSIMPGCSYTSFYGYWICLTLILLAAILIVVAWDQVIDRHLGEHPHGADDAVVKPAAVDQR